MMTKTMLIPTCLVAVMVLFLIPAISFSNMVSPSLNPINAGLRMPEDVAIGPDGKIYAVDGSNGKVQIYDRKGQPAGSISIQKPTSVAVNGSGNIYVGTNSDLSVKVYNASLTMIGTLGSGANEFRLPRNVTIDGTSGNVYVVDQLDNSIKVYAPGGAYITKINDYPNLPQDVTILNNEIYVIDSPLMVDNWGGTIRGAEVQVFNMSGNPVRHFGSYGAQEGQFIRPAGITSDAGGVLYVTDSFHGVVMCFNSNGSYLGAIQNPLKPMVTPMGIALGGDKRLFIASVYTGSIHVFGLEGYTNMGVSPSELSYTAQQGQSNPLEQTLTISNSGTGTLTYTVASTDNWIVIAAPTGSIGPSGSGTVSVGVNISTLSAGTYSGNITVTGDSGASEVVKVSLVITAPPVLSVTPQGLDFTYKIGDAEPASQAVTVEITGGVATWTATPDSSWISIDPLTVSGNAYTQAAVNVHPSNLSAGTYKGNITIDALGALGSPVNVEVNLIVQSAGTISVSCNIAAASFTIAGPKNYEGSGQSWTTTEVTDGQYTITYNPVTGYKTPQTETKTISGGSQINFEGNYVSFAMTADIVVSHAADTKNPPVVGIFDASGKMYTSFVPFSLGKYSKASDKNLYGKTGVNTAVGDIDGDGKADILVGLAAGSSNPARVAAYRSDGTMMEGSDFIALSTMYGANVAAADFDGDGSSEIVVGAGISAQNPAQVRIFKYESGAVTDTGINFNASKVKGGVNIATGDVDGDGIPELITSVGANKNTIPEVRVWKINTSGVPWSVIDTGIHFVAFSGKYASSVTTGDINGDGVCEIITAGGPDPNSGPNVIRVFNGNGTEFGLVITDSSTGYGLNVASADLDNDGIADIVAGLGPSSENPATVKVYKADGALSDSFSAFTGTRFGAVLSVGDLGY